MQKAQTEETSTGSSRIGIWMSLLGKFIYLSVVILVLLLCWSLWDYRSRLERTFSHFDMKVYVVTALSVVLIPLYLVRWWRAALVLLLFHVFLLEFGLRVMGFMGVLPFDYYRFTPYAHSYVAREYFETSSMNRYGWHDIDQSMRPDVPKVAIIGDSFIQAYSVDPRRHLGQKLREKFSDEAQVFEFGISGAGPGFYLEMLKYAHQVYGVDAAVVSIFLGNDFRNLMPEMDDRTPLSGMFYEEDLNEVGRFQMHPLSQAGRVAWWQERERNHWPLLPNIFRMAKGKLLSPVAVRWLLSKLEEPAKVGMSDGEGGEVEVKVGGGEAQFDSGLDMIISSPRPDPRKDEMLLRMEDMLRRIATYAENNGISLKVFSIPIPPSERDRNPDFLPEQPTRLLEEICSKLELPFVSMRPHLQEDLGSQDLSPVFRGHFSYLGHEAVARVLWRELFQRGAWPSK
jgi:hypothetical protein